MWMSFPISWTSSWVAERYCSTRRVASRSSCRRATAEAPGPRAARARPNAGPAPPRRAWAPRAHALGARQQRIALEVFALARPRTRERPRVDGSRRRRRRDAPPRGARAGEPGRYLTVAPPGDHVGRGEERGVWLGAQRRCVEAIVGCGRPLARAAIASPCSTASPAPARPRSTSPRSRRRSSVGARRSCSFPRSGSPRRRSAGSHPASATPLRCCTRRSARASASTSGDGCARARPGCASGPARPSSRLSPISG